MKSSTDSTQQFSLKQSFNLPKQIVRKVKALTRSIKECENESCKFLWIYFDGASKSPLTLDDWLSIIDEAACHGANCMVVRIEGHIADSPVVREFCTWAQTTHGITAGVHLASGDVSDADIAELEKLLPDQTFLLVPHDAVNKLKHIEKKGIGLCSADVTRKDHEPPCDLPANILCIGPDGKLYTCGLVLGEEEYCMGHVFDHKLQDVVENESSPRYVPENACYKEHGCDACPPIMRERLQDALQKRKNGKKA